MKELYIKEIYLKNYRNFSNFKIDVPKTPIILTGKNGSGKTNILESISLISPGRGIRGAKFQEISRNNQYSFFAQYIIESKLGEVEIINNFNFLENKRIVQFNGTNIPANDLNKLTNILWITPQMNGIFLEPPKIRRRFLDRIIFNFDADYAKYINNYEYYVQERIKLLLSENDYRSLLNDYEEKIAYYALFIIRARYKILDMLQEALKNIIEDFPDIILKIEGEIENNVNNSILKGYSFDSEDKIKMLEPIIEKLKQTRSLDKLIGKTSFGPHKSDFVVTHATKNVLAKFCSTGEQKAMLISILIAQINLCINQNNVKPIVLLDEIFTSLDQFRKDYLTKYFSATNLQLWITATDIKNIEGLVSYAKHIDLDFLYENAAI